MDKIRVVILESDERTLYELTKHFDCSKRIKVCGKTVSGEEGLELIERIKPDAVIVDLVLKERDGFDVLGRLKEEKCNYVKIVTGAFTDDRTLRKVVDFGADYYMVKPYSCLNLEERICEYVKNKIYGNFSPVVQNSFKNIDRKLTDIFISLGISAQNKGYGYLKEGVKLVIRDRTIINSVTKRLYPEIATMFNSSGSKVERAIRHSISVAWGKKRTEAIKFIFGSRSYIGSEVPTNSEFIALVADIVSVE